MNNIKVIPNLEPWEVMKRANEGEPVANRRRGNVPHIWSSVDHPNWNWGEQAYAIIDTSEPAIDWNRFDLNFFNVYGGLLCEYQGAVKKQEYKTVLPMRPGDWSPLESPFYYWPGGECPVPHNVEIELVFRNCKNVIGVVNHCRWDHNNAATDIIAFRLTGNVFEGGKTKFNNDPVTITINRG